MRSEEFANLTFEQNVDRSLRHHGKSGKSFRCPRRAKSDDGPTDNQFDSDFDEGPIGDVRFLGTVDRRRPSASLS